MLVQHDAMDEKRHRAGARLGKADTTPRRLDAVSSDGLSEIAAHIQVPLYRRFSASHVRVPLCQRRRIGRRAAHCRHSWRRCQSRRSKASLFRSNDGAAKIPEIATYVGHCQSLILRAQSEIQSRHSRAHRA